MKYLENSALKYLLIFYFITLPALVFAQQGNQISAPKEDKVLHQKLEKAIADFDGDVGIYVRHLERGNTASIAADSVFPSASMVKIPIMVGVFHQIELGNLQYEQPLRYRDSLLYEGEDILGSFQDSAVIHLDKVIMLMVSTSDNTASLWSQHLAGTGSAINALLQQSGFSNTRVNSRTTGRSVFQKKYGWGQTTPREMAELLVNIRQGKVISQKHSERMYRLLTRTYWDQEAISQIPPTVQVASKQGAVNQSRSEVVLVNAPSGDYVFCVITKNQQDESWESNNEGFKLLRNISALLWNHFEPNHPYLPAQ